MATALPQSARRILKITPATLWTRPDTLGQAIIIRCTSAGNVVERDPDGVESTIAMTAGEFCCFDPEQIMANSTATVELWYS